MARGRKHFKMALLSTPWQLQPAPDLPWDVSSKSSLHLPVSPEDVFYSWDSAVRHIPIRPCLQWAQLHLNMYLALEWHLSLGWFEMYGECRSNGGWILKREYKQCDIHWNIASFKFVNVFNMYFCIMKVSPGLTQNSFLGKTNDQLLWCTATKICMCW